VRTRATTTGYTEKSTAQRQRHWCGSRTTHQEVNGICGPHHVYTNNYEPHRHLVTTRRRQDHVVLYRAR